MDKPNLAATYDGRELPFPLYVSPKIDGIRAMAHQGVLYSRSLKPIPNPYVQAWAEANRLCIEGLDGELVVGKPNDPNAMQNSMQVMSKSAGPLDFTFNVFDVWSSSYPFGNRLGRVYEQVGADRKGRSQIVPQILAHDQSRFDQLEAEFLERGYEGMMARSPQGLYKNGRSTMKELGLFKVKRFSDAEAIIVGYEEEMHNANERAVNELGQLRPSSHAAGLQGKGTLGAFVLRNEQGVTFRVGTGYTAAQRAQFWKDREVLVGSMLTYKFFDHGIIEAPRHPVFKSLRHPDDMRRDPTKVFIWRDKAGSGWWYATNLSHPESRFNPVGRGRRPDLAYADYVSQII